MKRQHLWGIETMEGAPQNSRNDMKAIVHIIASARPHQWVKNIFVFIPLIFAQKIFDYHSLTLSVQAFFAFSLMSSAVYLFNDVLDMEADRQHPEKMHRPIAAGLVSPFQAIVACAVLLGASVGWAAFIRMPFLLVLLIYLLIQILYTFRLKEIVILDIFCVSSGFFLRVVAGGVAIQIAISHWLIICATLLSLFLAMAKRRHELTFLGPDRAGVHRRVLSGYSVTLLDQMIGVVTASSLLSYMLYCVSPETILKFQTDHLVYTFPFVLFGIFRYLYLIHTKKQGGTPEKILISDAPILVSIILWGISCILIIYGVI